MANASEMLNFFKRDADVASSSLQAQNLLAEAVQLAFGFLVDHMQAELGQAMPSFLNPRQDEPDQDGNKRPSAINDRQRSSLFHFSITFCQEFLLNVALKAF